MKTPKLQFARRILLNITCCSALLTGSVAHAVEILAQFNVGVGFSDNIARTPTNEIDETMGVAGINFGLVENSSRLRADIRSQFDYLYYADGTFDDEVVGGLSGTLDYVLIEERLVWTLQNNFGQQSSNPLAAANPGNRENVNFLSTGPTINLLPGSRNQAQIDLRYSSLNFETQNSDNDRYSAALSLGREIRRGVSLSLNANTQRIEYDNGGLSPDFDRHEGFVRYSLVGDRNTLETDVGYTQIDIQGSKSDGVLLRLNWTREVTADTTFVLAGGSSYSDQGDVFRFDQSQASDIRDTVDVTSTSAPFTRDFLSASYNIARNRTSINVAINWSQDDFGGALTLDRTMTGANFDLRRDLSRSVFAGLSLRYRRRNFTDLNIADDLLSASLDVGYRFGPSTSVSAQYTYLEQSGSSAFTDSRENRIFVRFIYTPAWGR